MTTPAVYTRKTQEKLGAIVKKPALTEKLLSRPPFRFLQDVIVAVILSTGFMKEVYTAEELDSKKVLDKEGKMRFLNKVITAVETALQTKLSVRPAKIVAGLEPERTNDFLQALAKAATLAVKKGSQATRKPKTKDSSNHKTLHADEHVRRRSVERKQPDENSATTKSKPPVTGKGSEKTFKAAKSLVPEKEKIAKKKITENQTKPRESFSKELKRQLTHELLRETSVSARASEPSVVTADNAVQVKTAEKAAAKSVRVHKSRSESDHGKTLEKDAAKLAGKPSVENELKRSDILHTEPIARPSTAVESTAQADSETLPHARGLPSRPSTARAPPSRRQINQTTVLNLRRAEIPDEPKETNLMVIRQGSKNDDESGIHSDDFIIESADSDFLDRPNAEYLDGDSKLPGQLVRKILETKNQLEKEVVKSSQSTTLAWSDHVFESQERRKIQEEISNMQELLQSLARTAHPLAKTLEFLGEDSEQMLKECLQWRQEYKRNRLLLDQKRKQIDADLQALRNQSRVLEEEIEEKKKSILAMKRSTFMNEQKITKILHGVCSS